MLPQKQFDCSYEMFWCIADIVLLRILPFQIIIFIEYNNNLSFLLHPNLSPFRYE